MSIKTIGVIGSSDEEPELNSLAEEMGRLIATAGYSLVTGGRTGVMAAASKGAKQIDPRPETVRVIGILPGEDKSEGNMHLDYAIPTGLGWARNQVVVLASDIIVAIGGGAGTLSEMSYAWAYNKPIIAFDGVDGWSAKLSGKKIDEKRDDAIIRVSSPEKAIKIINDIYSKQLH